MVSCNSSYTSWSFTRSALRRSSKTSSRRDSWRYSGARRRCVKGVAIRHRRDDSSSNDTHGLLVAVGAHSQLEAIAIASRDSSIRPVGSRPTGLASLESRFSGDWLLPRRWEDARLPPPVLLVEPDETLAAAEGIRAQVIGPTATLGRSTSARPSPVKIIRYGSRSSAQRVVVPTRTLARPSASRSRSVKQWSSFVEPIALARGSRSSSPRIRCRRGCRARSQRERSPARAARSRRRRGGRGSDRRTRGLLGTDVRRLDPHGKTLVGERVLDAQCQRERIAGARVEDVLEPDRRPRSTTPASA